jgi:hypothetical protein
MIKRCQHCETWNHLQRSECRKCYRRLDRLCPSDTTPCSAAFARLDEDISDRRGLKWEWSQIAGDVMQTEIRPTWEGIISGAIEHAMKDLRATIEALPTNHYGADMKTAILNCLPNDQREGRAGSGASPKPPTL